MDENQKKRNRALIERVIRGLQKRNIEGYYAEGKQEALELALSLIPKGAVVAWGGSHTISQIGLKQAVVSGDYVVINRDCCNDAKEKRRTEVQALASDYFLASCNAITEDGILVNIDGNANRVAAIAFGPEHVILIVGAQKIAKDVEAAVSRIRHVAAPVIVQGFPLTVPCKTLGSCVNCLASDTVCCQFLITRYSRHTGRIKVILVNDQAGY